MEKLVRKALLKHMIDNKYLSNSQHGFVSGRSCTTQLLKVVDRLTEILDGGGSVDMIYLDFAKAFDTVPHRRLLVKLEGYGVGGELLRWIEQFLVGRRQRVGVAGDMSSWSSVLSGVPQGSVLGPVLFVCYINDLPEAISSVIHMYADDTKIFRKVDEVVDREELQRDLDRLGKWTADWQLRFNVSKCRIMHIGAGNPGAGMTMTEGSTTSLLEETRLEKDLGVWFSYNLKPHEHVARTVSKANQILGLIRRTFTYMDPQLMKQLFTSMVRPLLEYANVVWHPYLQKDIELIEAVQHRATRMIPGYWKFGYEERLQKLDLPTLAYRRLRGDVIEVYKYLHGKYSVEHTEMLPLHRKEGMLTRGHQLKLRKRQCEGLARANVFGMRMVRIWNMLPTEVVTAPSVNCLKGRFDRCTRAVRFHSVIDMDELHGLLDRWNTEQLATSP